MGAHKKPFYRFIVANSRARRDGPFVEVIGTHDPKKEPSEIKVNLDRAKHWIELGAQPTDIVRKLLQRAGM